MHPSLRSKYLALESDLDNLLKELSAYPENILEIKPSPGAWSVLENLQHMMVVERGSLNYVKKKTSYPDNLKKGGLSGFWRKQLMLAFFRLPIKIKAPDLVNENKFEKGKTFGELVNDWRQLRQEMLGFLENVPDEILEMLAYKHAVAGRLTLDGMMVFFDVHFRRHRKQIEKTLNIVASKKTKL